jgi:hypothetical protein
MPKHSTVREIQMVHARPSDYRKMSDVQLLEAALALLHTRRERWCQGSNALNAAGLPVSPVSDAAQCWCLRGACLRALQPSPSTLSVDAHHEGSDLNKQIARACGFDTPAKGVQWNDTQGRTWEEVIERIKRRIGECAFTKKDRST